MNNKIQLQLNYVVGLRHDSTVTANVNVIKFNNIALGPSKLVKLLLPNSSYQPIYSLYLQTGVLLPNPYLN